MSDFLRQRPKARSEGPTDMGREGFLCGPKEKVWQQKGPRLFYCLGDCREAGRCGIGPGRIARVNPGRRR